MTLVEPGNYDTAIWATAPRTTPTGSAYTGMTTIVADYVDQQHVPQSRDPREVAHAVARVLTARRPAFRVPVGPDARIAAVLARLPYRLTAIAVRRVTGLHRWRP